MGCSSAAQARPVSVDDASASAATQASDDLKRKANQFQMMPTSNPKVKQRRTQDSCHSYVQTATVTISDESTLQNKPDVHEEFLLPPRVVAKTDTRTLGRAFMRNLEHWMFDMAFKHWLAFVAVHVCCLIVLVSADSASANRRLCNQLQTLLLTCAQEWLGTASKLILLFLFDACTLHQLCRCVTFTLEAHGILTPMYSLSKIVRLRSHKMQALHALRRVLADPNIFVFHANTEPPEREDAVLLSSILQLVNPDEIIQSRILLAERTPQPPHGQRPPREQQLPQEQQPHDHSANSSEPDRMAFLVEMADFFHGPVVKRKLVHYCKGPSCCKNRRHAEARAVLRQGCVDFECLLIDF
jgi:hypothetical protein